MDHRSRVLNAVRFKKTDRPPFDLFDECGDLFTDGRYDPALRIGLPMQDQVDARVRFQQEFDTDLIFDAPVIGASTADFRVSLAPDAAARHELREAFFPMTACLWMPWSPHVVPKQGHSITEADSIEYILEWDNGLRLSLFLETASGNPSGYEHLMKDREQWPLWKQVFAPAFDRFDFSFIDRMTAKTRGEVALYGTTFCPYGLMTLLLGLEQAATIFLDEPEYALGLMDYFTEIVIEVGRELFRRGVDLLRIGAATTSLLGPALYEEFVLPYHRRIASALRESGGLSILHCCGHVNAMLEAFARAGWDGLEPLTPPPLGNVALADAKRRVGDRVCLKGNLDPVNVMKEADADSVALATRECLETGARAGGYILSVADCMAPGTLKANMEIVADVVHRFKP
jgi:hypothetical protein